MCSCTFCSRAKGSCFRSGWVRCRKPQQHAACVAGSTRVLSAEAHDCGHPLVLLLHPRRAPSIPDWAVYGSVGAQLELYAEAAAAAFCGGMATSQQVHSGRPTVFGCTLCIAGPIPNPSSSCTVSTLSLGQAWAICTGVTAGGTATVEEADPSVAAFAVLLRFSQWADVCVTAVGRLWTAVGRLWSVPGTTAAPKV